NCPRLCPSRPACGALHFSGGLYACTVCAVPGSSRSHGLPRNCAVALGAQRAGVSLYIYISGLMWLQPAEEGGQGFARCTCNPTWCGTQRQGHQGATQGKWSDKG
ncbi:hypothetical protein KUCAC02_011085, partial [Chaenocephalus aceratus]